MRVLGVDCSTYTGLCLYDSDTEKSVTKLLNFQKTIGIRRVQLIAGAFEQALLEYKPDLAAIEGFAYGNKNSLVTLTELVTPLKLALLKLHIPWYEVPPNVLKKWTTGNGNAKKPEMAKFVKDIWDYEPMAMKGDDLVDAYALARLGYHLHTAPEKGLKTKVTYHAQ